VTGRGPEPKVRDEGDCGTLGLTTGACTMENEAKAPAQCERHVICDAAAYKEQALPERSELETPPVAFICATRADRPAAAATAASAADCVMGGAAERPGGGVGSFLREASRLSSASARESKTSGCILLRRKMCSPVALQLNEFCFLHRSFCGVMFTAAGCRLQGFGERLGGSSNFMLALVTRTRRASIRTNTIDGALSQNKTLVELLGVGATY
jgi:hypothetical protein